MFAFNCDVSAGQFTPASASAYVLFEGQNAAKCSVRREASDLLGQPEIKPWLLVQPRALEMANALRPAQRQSDVVKTV